MKASQVALYGLATLGAVFLYFGIGMSGILNAYKPRVPPSPPRPTPHPPASDGSNL